VKKQPKQIEYRMPDDDYQVVKQAIREHGYGLPTTKVIYEVVAKMEKELTTLCLGIVDELCHEDWLIQEDIRKLEHYYHQRRLATFLGTMAAFDGPYSELGK